MRGRIATSGRAAFATLVAAGAVLVASAACTAPTVGPDPLERATPKQTKPKAPPESDTPPEVKKADAGSTADTCETVPPTNKCGLDPQCGCLETETCDVTNRATGATSCVTAGTTTLGRPCSQSGDCMAGLGCLYGACRPYCKTPLTKCSVGGTELCVTMPDDDGKPVPNLSFCTINCDPREPAGVCGVNACHWFATLYAPNKVSDCNFAGNRGELQTCTYDSDCQPGLACIEHPKHGRECERWCRIGYAGDCGSNAAFKCKDVFGADAPVINGVKEGICQDD
ncbi:MAG: hypothetical protein KF764_20580 [Labilithrix sp.]|nr:hypothetical protein [Labilithrix sp.]